LNYPDTVEVGARVTKIGNSSIHMEHCIFSRGQQAVAARIRSILVTFDYAANRPVPVPASIRSAIESLEATVAPRNLS
jgi:acyl-CoA thioester hydrolase